MTLFDSNAMNELRHHAADRYQRSGGGGAFKVYVSSKAYFDARGYADMSPWQKAVVENIERYRQVVMLNRAHYSTDCFRAREGIGHDQDIPF